MGVTKSAHWIGQSAAKAAARAQGRRGPWRRQLLTAAALAAMTGGAGCVFVGSDAQPVGSTHIAVLSATPWDDYKDKLAPAFGLDAKQALAAVVPDTSQVEQSMLDAFRAKARVALAPSAVLAPGFGAAGAADAQPQQTSAGTSLPTSGLGDTLPGSPGAAPAIIDRTKLGSEPFLQHLAATALFQEVRLLERYTTDAVQRDGYRAYVVRLQVTNMPYRRDQAFDTYANIAFFMTPVEQPAQFQDLGLTAALLRAKQLTAQGRFREALAVAQAGKQAEQQRNDQPNPNDGKRQDQRKDQPRLPNTPATPPADHHNAETSPVPLAVMQPFDPATDAPPAAPTVEASPAQNPPAPAAESIGDARPRPRDRAAADPKDTTAADVNPAVQAAKTAIANADDVDTVIRNLQSIDPKFEKPARLPIVVPLLVTDQVEAALTAQRAEQLKQLGLALAAAYAGIGGSIDLEQLDRAVRSSIGRDYNSLFTVARLADNAVRIRIGARQILAGTPKGSPKDWDIHERDFQTIPQTHNVSLLLLVPTEQTTGRVPVYVGMQTEYRHPDTGTTFSHAEHAASPELYALLTNQGYGFERGPNLLALAGDAQNGRYEQFCARLDGADRPVWRSASGANRVALANGEKNNLWTQLIAARVNSETDSTEFHVPAYALKNAPELPSTQAFMIDNGETATMLVSPAYGFDALRTSAVWTFTPASTKQEVKLGSSSAAITGRGQLTLTFPSLLKNKILLSPDDKLDPSTLEVFDQGVAVSPAGAGGGGGWGASKKLVAQGRFREALAAAQAGKQAEQKQIKVASTFAVAPKSSTVAMTADKNIVKLADVPGSAGGAASKVRTDEIELAFLADGPLFATVKAASADELRKLLKDGKVFTVSIDGASMAIKNNGNPDNAVRTVTGTTALVVAGVGNCKMDLGNLEVGADVKIILTPPKGSGEPTTIKLTIK